MGGDAVLSVIVPVFNERESIRQVLDGIAAPLEGTDHEIIAVDDASTDGSSGLLASLPGIRVIAHEENCGYGASLKDGIRAARGDALAIIDADGTYPAERITEMLSLLGKFPMVVGAREPLPRFNRLAKAMLGLLVWLLTRKHVPDLNSGLRLFRRDTAERFMHLLPDGYSFTTTLTIGCLVNHIPVRYLPIRYRPRIGTSKIRPVRDFFNFALLIVRLVTYFKPLEVYLPASFALFAAGGAVGLYSLVVNHRVMDVTTVILIVFAFQVALLGLLADIIIRKR